MHHGAVAEGSWDSESVLVPDAEAALELLRARLAAGDVVLVRLPTPPDWARWPRNWWPTGWRRAEAGDETR